MPEAGWALVALTALYAGQVLAWALGLRRSLASPAPSLASPFVSVVVPARNEAAHVEACVAALLDSNYPADRFEVIVVDDFSTDGTAERVEALQRDADAQHLRLIRLATRLDDEREGHKGAALAWGLREATGSVLLTTDADCTVSAGWIRGMVDTLGSATGMVAGSVRMDPDGAGWFGQWQALEFAGLVAVGAGALGIGAPFMCNSAALAYPRRLFEAMGLSSPGAAALPERVTPWDDELLLLRVADDRRLTARFCGVWEAVVTARPEPTLRQVWRQRRRWAALGSRYPGRWRGGVMRLIWCAYAALIVSLVALVAWPSAWPYVAAAFALKTAAEVALLAPFLHHVRQLRLLAWHLPMQIPHAAYVVVLGLVSLGGTPAWKGRSFEPEALT